MILCNLLSRMPDCKRDWQDIDTKTWSTTFQDLDLKMIPSLVACCTESTLDKKQHCLLFGSHAAILTEKESSVSNCLLKKLFASSFTAYSARLLWKAAVLLVVIRDVSLYKTKTETWRCFAINADISFQTFLVLKP